MRDASIANHADIDFPIRRKTPNAAIEKQRCGTTCNHAGQELSSIHALPPYVV
jgi:hypothetical protein